MDDHLVSSVSTHLRNLSPPPNLHPSPVLLRGRLKLESILHIFMYTPCSLEKHSINKMPSLATQEGLSFVSRHLSS